LDSWKAGSPGMVAHVCNSSYRGGIGRRIPVQGLPGQNR
jgi:hypothetical protein